ncbi:MAG TPA: hypothetical protein VFN88_05685 [Caulobacteraceae bacterium]|nr:hypothetical protein [Caulobacteraceae bacterium]
MKRAVVLVVGAILIAVPAAAADKGGYKAPRNVFGQPDLGVSWTNATLTPEQRAAQFGDRLVLSPQEVQQLEGAAATEFKIGNAPTDPNAPAPKYGGEIVKNVRPAFAAAGGAVGGYNLGWLDPGMQLMRVNGQPRSSLLTTANGRVPPRKPGAPAFRQRIRTDEGEGGTTAGPADNPEDRTLGDRCIVFGRSAAAPMLPNGFYNNSYQFAQNKDEVVIEVEMAHDARHISLNRKEHLPSNIRPWFGDSIGHWEGDTLVVETTNMPERQAYNGSWQNLKITERFTRVANDRLLYQFTIDDPTIWEKPWGGEYEFSPLKGQMYEYACHEGNYALEGILAGERQREADTKKAAAK